MPTRIQRVICGRSSGYAMSVAQQAASVTEIAVKDIPPGNVGFLYTGARNECGRSAMWLSGRSLIAAETDGMQPALQM